jgi:hypothetical protein
MQKQDSGYIQRLNNCIVIKLEIVLAVINNFKLFILRQPVTLLEREHYFGIPINSIYGLLRKFYFNI